jgi:hypothetical protein
MYTLILHIPNDDPVVGEVEDLPATTDISLTLNNPRRRDGKDIHYLDRSVVTVIWPMNQIAFIEILPGEEEEKIISFVRE